jgi:hypothetical protein
MVSGWKLTNVSTALAYAVTNGIFKSAKKMPKWFTHLCDE